LRDLRVAHALHPGLYEALRMRSSSVGSTVPGGIISGPANAPKRTFM